MFFGKTFQEKQIDAKGCDYDNDTRALKRRITFLEGALTDIAISPARHESDAQSMRDIALAALNKRQR